ncbi:MAG: hypothetical protein ACTSXH_00515, partial [Promethearchaeota archaeon]
LKGLVLTPNKEATCPMERKKELMKNDQERKKNPFIFVFRSILSKIGLTSRRLSCITFSCIFPHFKNVFLIFDRFPL